MSRVVKNKKRGTRNKKLSLDERKLWVDKELSKIKSFERNQTIMTQKKNEPSNQSNQNNQNNQLLEKTLVDVSHPGIKPIFILVGVCLILFSLIFVLNPYSLNLFEENNYLTGAIIGVGAPNNFISINDSENNYRNNSENNSENISGKDFVGETIKEDFIPGMVEGDYVLETVREVPPLLIQEETLPLPGIENEGIDNSSLQKIAINNKKLFQPNQQVWKVISNSEDFYFEVVDEDTVRYKVKPASKDKPNKKTKLKKEKLKGGFDFINKNKDISIVGDSGTFDLDFYKQEFDKTDKFKLGKNSVIFEYEDTNELIFNFTEGNVSIIPYYLIDGELYTIPATQVNIRTLKNKFKYGYDIDVDDSTDIVDLDKIVIKYVASSGIEFIQDGDYGFYINRTCEFVDYFSGLFPVTKMISCDLVFDGSDIVNSMFENSSYNISLSVIDNEALIYINNNWSLVDDGEVIVIDPSVSDVYDTTPGGTFTNTIWDYVDNIKLKGDAQLIMKFDDNESKTYDLSVNANHIDTTAPSYFNSCKFGSSCLTFDGSNDYVELGHYLNSEPYYKNLNEISVCAWYKASSVSTINYLVTIGYYGSSLTWILSEISNHLRFGTRNLTGSYDYGIDPDAPPLNRWVSICGTKNMTHTGLYVDGVLKASEPSGGGIFLDQNHELVIGGIGSVGYVMPIGVSNSLISCVQVWNHSLTYENITTVNNSVICNSNFENPISTWKLDTYTKVQPDSNGINDGDMGPFYNSSGVYGGAYDFDGIDDYVDVGNDLSLNIRNNITVSAWVKTTDIDAGPVIGKNYLGGVVPFRIFVSDTTSVNAFGVYNGSVTGGWIQASSSTKVTDGNWHHLLGTYDSSNLIYYIDGVQRGITPFSGNLPTNDGNVYIGKYATTYFFNGTIDNVLIYDRTLSPSEVSSLYDGSKATYDYIPKYDPPGNYISTVYDAGAIYNWLSLTLNGSFDNDTVVDRTIPTDNSLVSWWTFDNTTDDLMGENDATATGAKYDESGRGVNGSYRCDGIDDTIVADNPTAFNFMNQSHSVSAMVSFNEFTGNWQVIYNKGNMNLEKQNLFLGERSSSNIICYGYWSTAITACKPTSELETNRFYHIVGTWNESNFQIYFDGELEDTSASTNLNFSNSYPVTFCDVSYYAASYFNGLIDEFKIWNKTLTTEEVKEEYRRSAGNKVSLQFRTSEDDSVWSSWYNNEVPNLQTGLINLNSSIPKGQYVQYKSIYDVADEEFSGNLERVKIEYVSNLAPTHDTPVLNSSLGTNSTNENLTVYAQNVADADGDAVVNITDWRLWNGTDAVSIATLNMPFEGGSSSTSTKDYSSYSNNGTVSEAIWNSTGGYGGFGAYEFDGVDDYITLPASNKLITGSEGTLAAWVKSESGYNLGARIITIHAGSGVGSGFNIVIAGGKWSSYSRDETSGAYLSSNVAVDTDWHFITTTNDGITHRIYVDGVEKNNQLIGMIAGSHVGYIGHYDTSTQTYAWNGTIDEVKIFNRSLSSEQIMALYENKTDLIVSQETNKSEVWQACVTPNDGKEDGTEKCSNNLTITDMAPTINSVNVTPAIAYTNDTLSCTFNISDLDSDNILVNVTWFATYANGTVNSSWTGDDENSISVTLNSISTTTGIGNVEWNTIHYNEQWLCQISVNDGASTLIRNSTPVTISSYSTLLSVFDKESDAESEAQSIDTKVYVNEYTTFYANFSSPTTGKDLKMINTKSSNVGSAYSVVAVDLDGDGDRTDIITGESGDISAFYGNGTLAWNNNAPSSYVFEVKIIDINNDNSDEIVTVDYNGFVRIFNRTGEEIYATEDLGSLFYSVDVGDLDGDGLAYDFVVGGTIGSSYGIAAFIHNGTTWNNAWNATESISKVYEVEIKEFVDSPNIVGIADFAGARGLIYYAENGTLKFSADSDLGTIRSIEFLDLDNDGVEDEVVYGEDGELRAYDENGISLWDATQTLSSSYEVKKADLDLDGYEDDTIVADHYGNVWGIDESGATLWNFVEPQEINQHYDPIYFTELEVGDVNDDGDIDILVGGYSRTLWVLNRTGSVIGRYFTGFEAGMNANTYLGYPSGSQSGIDLMGDTNNDGVTDFAFTHGLGFVYFAQQVLCEITFNDTGVSKYMNYNYTSNLYEYYRAFDESNFDMSQENNQIFTWNVTCSKGGYHTNISSNSQIVVYNKNSSIDVFDQEDDEEDNAGWLLENARIMAGEDTYFFANYSNKELNQSLEELGFDEIWTKDLGSNMFGVEWADLNHDGFRDEAIIIESSDLWAYYINGTEIWHATEPYGDLYDVAVGDLDNDGYYDDIVVTESGDQIRVFNETGNQVWTSGDIGDWTIGIEIGDLDKDGIEDDILVGHDNGPGYAIVAYNTSDGITWTEMWEFANTAISDGTFEVRIGKTNSSYDYQYVSATGWTAARAFMLYSNNGSVVWVNSTDHGTIYSLDFVDLDSDGNEDEMVLGETGDLIAYDETGNRLWVSTLPSNSIYDIKKADLDHDGYQDEVVITDLFYLMAFDENGDRLWTTTYDAATKFYMSLQIADLNNDGFVEILAANEDDIVYVYNSTGTLLYKYETQPGSSVTDMNRMGYSGYTGDVIAVSGNTAENRKYVLIAAEDVGTYLLEPTPRCMIGFNDSVTSRMMYNQSADLFYYNRSFTDAATYKWNISCSGENFVSQSVITKDITIVTLPIVSNVVLNSSLGTNLTTENLTLHFSVSGGDSVANITDWRLWNGTDPVSIAVLNMPFEGGSSSTFTKDYSSYSNHGTVSGAVWNSTGGKDSKGAYVFDGSSSYIDLGTNFDNVNSISVWIKTSSSATNQRIITNGNGVVDWTLQINSGDLMISNAMSGTDTILTSTANYNDGQWHHIVAGVNPLELYVDGVSVSASLGVSTISVDGNAKIGAKSSSQFFYNGVIDEVKIFNNILSPEQIQALYNNRTDLIVSQETNKTDIWQACITPNDGTEDGIEVCSNDLTILNTAPTHNTPILNSSLSTNLTTENLTVYAQNVVDIDNDAVVNITDWRLWDGTDPVSIAVLNMPFEGGSNSIFTKDYSSYSNHGTVSEAIWNSTGGYDSKGAYEFDGVDDKISVGTIDLSPNAGEASVFFWIKSNDKSVEHEIFHKANDIVIRTRATGKFTVYIYGAADGAYWDGATDILDGVWHHVGFTYNNVSENVTYYFDGNIDLIRTGKNGTIGTSSVATLGSWSAANFNGTMDEVSVWNKELSSEQVLAMYENKTDTIVSQETNSGEVWQACITPNDGTEDGIEKCSNNLTIAMGNNLPTAPLLLSLADGSSTISRTPMLVWNNSIDLDGDTISYNLLIDDNPAFNNPEVNVNSIINTSVDNTTYLVETELEVDTTYFWKVQGNDSSGYGAFSEVFNFTLDSYLAISVLDDIVDFGLIGSGSVLNTTAGDYGKFKSENVGNILSNVTITGTFYFNTSVFPSNAYQFKIVENKSNAFDVGLSTVDWTDMDGFSSNPHVIDLDWHDFKNDFLTHLLIRVPDNEPAGTKSTTVTFTIE